MGEGYSAGNLFSYAGCVQPVFDKHCVSCHDYGKEAGKKLNLCGDKTLIFNTSYENLWKKGIIQVEGAGYSIRGFADEDESIFGDSDQEARIKEIRETRDRMVISVAVSAFIMRWAGCGHRP